MPSSKTAYDLIKGSMRLIGAIAPGETPTAMEANDGLDTLNDLLEAWSTENLSVWGSANDTFATVAGQAVYTIGPGGNWNGDRPVRIRDGYCTYQGADFPLLQWGQDDYNAVILKTLRQDIVERFLYVNDNPLGLITLYPVPSGVVNVTFPIDRVLTQVPTLATVLVYPPGYYIAMKHALAIMLAPDYGRIVSQEVKDVATITKADISRANKPKRYAKFDTMLLDDERTATWQRGY